MADKQPHQLLRLGADSDRRSQSLSELPPGLGSGNVAREQAEPATCLARFTAMAAKPVTPAGQIACVGVPLLAGLSVWVLRSFEPDALEPDMNRLGWDV